MNIQMNLKNMDKKQLGIVVAVGVCIIGLGGWMMARGSSGEIITPQAVRSNGPEAHAYSEAETYKYTDAPNHVGEKAVITGTVLKVFTSKSGVIFFDFCQKSSSCPFSAVIFASDADKFKDLGKYQREVKLTGVIKSYKGKAEMVIEDPEQIE